jgi:DNA-binding NarL/FixJ family response regulator
MALLVESFLDEVGFPGPATVGQSAPPDGLSTREVEVLRLIAAGKSNPQIAEELVISLNTVQRHVSNILAKTGLSNRTEAASYATRNGLV